MDIEKIRKFFKADVFADETGAVIDAVGENAAVCSIRIEPRHYNAGGAVQGGVIFTLADFAFAVAANSSGNLTVSLSNNIVFLRPPVGDKITATAKLVSETKRTCCYEVTVTDTEADDTADDVIDKNKAPVAIMTVNGYKKGVAIDF